MQYLPCSTTLSARLFVTRQTANRLMFQYGSNNKGLNFFFHVLYNRLCKSKKK